MPTRYQLDLCDELGLMIYEESYAGWPPAPSPKMAERFDREICEMIRRDRNHPSVVMWGLLNETSDGPVFRHAVDSLPLVRSLDDTRVVMLDSGMFHFIGGGGGLAGIRCGTAGRARSRMSPATAPRRRFRPWASSGTLAESRRTPVPTASILRCAGPLRRPASMPWRPNSPASPSRSTTDVHGFRGANRSLTARQPSREWQRGGLQNGPSPSRPARRSTSSSGWGNGQYGGDTTAVAATLRAGTSVGYDAARDFSIEKNPCGVWSYGYLSPGQVPDASTFKPFSKGETIAPSRRWGL